MNQKRVLIGLQKAYPKKLHLFSEQLKLEDWKKQGQPYTWKVLTQAEGGPGLVSLLVDTGYGNLALVRNDIVLETGHQSIETDEYVALADYHGYPNGAIYKRIK
jgi:hypothetical protein